MGDLYASSFFSNNASSRFRFREQRAPVFTFVDVTCAICIDTVKNRAFVNSCSHVFCLGCLLKWTKQKLECPLCIRPFNEVYYCVRSPTVYKKIPTRCLIEQSDELCSGENGFYNSQFGRIRKILDFGHLLTVDDVHLPINIRPSMRQDAYSFRELVYENNYWAISSYNLLTPLRWIEPEYYVTYPEFVVRLYPWIYRELEVVLSDKEHLIDEAFDLIVSTLHIYEIYSTTFVNNLKPFLGEQTQHFLHELIIFISSRKLMPDYDQMVKYCTVNFLRDSDVRGAIVNFPEDHDFITIDDDNRPEISEGIQRPHNESRFPTTRYEDIVAITPGRFSEYRAYACENNFRWPRRPRRARRSEPALRDCKSDDVINITNTQLNC